MYRSKLHTLFFFKIVPWLFTIFIVINLISCNRNYTPKPRGYFRIDFPEKKYLLFESECPYSFEFPQYGSVNPDKDSNSEPCWLNIDFPKYKGRIHISYKKAANNITEYFEDSRRFVYKHTVKADAIFENIIDIDDKNVFGILYEIKGDAASSVQFCLTDSVNHFLRGALYFSVRPNKDSLAPVIDFFKEDIIHFIETFEWK